MSPGHHPFWQQPSVSLALWLDGPSQDLAAEAHPGRDHQETVRTAPCGPGHAGAHEEPAGCHHVLPSGHTCRTRTWTLPRDAYDFVACALPDSTSLLSGVPSVAVSLPVATWQRDGAPQGSRGRVVCGHRSVRRAQSQTL